MGNWGTELIPSRASDNWIAKLRSLMMTMVMIMVITMVLVMMMVIIVMKNSHEVVTVDNDWVRYIYMLDCWIKEEEAETWRQTPQILFSSSLSHLVKEKFQLNPKANS